MRDLWFRITRITVSIPLATASSTAYWISGLPATGSISLGTALVAGSILVPKPAAGITAFTIFLRVDTVRRFLKKREKKRLRGENRAGRSGPGFFILLLEIERIPISSRQLSVSGGKPIGARSSPERTPCAGL